MSQFADKVKTNKGHQSGVSTGVQRLHTQGQPWTRLRRQAGVKGNARTALNMGHGWVVCQLLKVACHEDFFVCISYSVNVCGRKEPWAEHPRNSGQVLAGLPAHSVLGKVTSLFRSASSVVDIRPSLRLAS